jgi:hypothetical protein
MQEKYFHTIPKPQGANRAYPHLRNGQANGSDWLPNIVEVLWLAKNAHTI